jgi:hypothetical protein
VALQIMGVVWFVILWIILGALLLVTAVVIKRLEAGAREGKYIQGL